MPRAPTARGPRTQSLAIALGSPLAPKRRALPVSRASIVSLMPPPARPEQDNRGAAQADRGAAQVPAVRLRAFDRPQPQPRRGDIDPPIRGLGAPPLVGVDHRPQPAHHPPPAEDTR